MASDAVDSAFRASPLFQELDAINETGDLSPLDSAARRQHVVPRFLLNHFAINDDGRYWIYQLDATRAGAPRRVQTKDAAAHRRFYSLFDNDGNRTNRIEGFLSRVESHAAPAIDRLLADPLALSGGDRATISFFIALQDQRTPAGLERSGGTTDALMRTLLSAQLSDRLQFASDYRRILGDDTDDEIERLRAMLLAGLRDGSIAFADPRVAALKAGLGVATPQSAVIFSMDWTLLRTAAAFITSERGLAIHDPSPPRPWTSQALLSSPDAETTIPLSTDACLRLTPGSGGIEGKELDGRGTDLLNLRTHGWADGYIYGRSQALLANLRRLARRRPNDVIRPRPRLTVRLIERDPLDDDLANENRGRGRPPYLPDENGILHDYILVPEDDRAGEAIARVNTIVRERARRAMGLPEGIEPPGRIMTDFLGLGDESPD